MKLTKTKIFLTAVALTAVAFAGCKKFLDVNQNPNATTFANPAQILPSVQGAVAHAVSYPYQNFGNFYSQYWTQNLNNSQFRGLDQYTTGPSDFDRSWSVLYSNAIADTDSLIVNQHLPKFQQYAAIAWLMRAYSFQMLTDAFGDIPLKEALKGRDNRSPHYDAQAEVYDSILVFIDRAKGLIDVTPANPYKPGVDDLLAGGDMTTWLQFANTLKLRVLLRLTTVNSAKAQAGIQALYAETPAPAFLAKDVEMKWTTTGGNQNPLYAERVFLNTPNQVASSTIMDRMKANNDPRISSFFALIGGQFVGTPQGSFIDSPSTKSVSRPSTKVLSATAPGRLISAAESFYLQSEAAARGWGTGNAKTLFESGIKANFATLVLTPAQAQAYIDDPAATASKYPVGDVNTQVTAIITQKWFSLCGSQGFEAWCEQRRTGVPALIKSQASKLGNDNFPARFIYPQAEVTRNGNFPGVVKIDTKVWWAK
ncbi:SusD/RagB family nutrient-binding outer membrane lipoprotein [Chitinophaga sp. SYP-B3965]|uniref:SusD/RagB family nutrient-binding outer membrane lipoprotein n=1 Tax=Chitinophaga sp. SYP-B3965 TaxID=2663120 RepID=UPI0012995849|nr:SusD/RagB family nutrient-binding outer membrane lipoprotein [Chitinophaga sp. SYP-B3965]MRG46258.1 SusD/RagB family nutrient-binding outer membrane lipoprotein [Chitinophaga sp. SYP-B3965]